MNEGTPKSRVKAKVHSLAVLVNRAAPISISLAFGPHNLAITANATVGGWPSGSTVCFTPIFFLRVLPPFQITFVKRKSAYLH